MTPEVILTYLLKIVILIILPALFSVVKTYITAWSKEKIKAIESREKQEIIRTIIEKIERAVEVVQQSYVDELKAENKFDKNAHQEAFDKAMATAVAVLTDDEKDFIESNYNDNYLFIESIIESYICNYINRKR